MSILPDWYLEGRKSAGLSLVLFVGAVSIGLLIGKDYAMWDNPENDVGDHVLNGVVFVPLLFAFSFSSTYFALHARSTLVDRRVRPVSLDDDIQLLWWIPASISIIAMGTGSAICSLAEKKSPALHLFCDFAKGFFTILVGATVYSFHEEIWNGIKKLLALPGAFFNVIADIVLALVMVPIVNQVQEHVNSNTVRVESG